MPDILHNFPIFAPVERVYQAVSTPGGLNAWWTKTCSGEPVEGAEFALGFGEDYQWQAVVTRARPDVEFELRITKADQDWTGSKVGFVLSSTPDQTNVAFHHRGWPEDNEHYRISCYCWAMYLRIMKRHIEFGEEVPYEERLDV
jgi:uncharacterized protein YndB with AHSA1/START domain